MRIADEADSLVRNHSRLIRLVLDGISFDARVERLREARGERTPNVG